MTSTRFPTQMRHPRSRRELLGLIGGSAVALLLAACGSGSSASQGTAAAPSPATPTAPLPASAPDFSARFAQFQAADEPEGDLGKVVRPDFVTKAGAEVQQLSR